MARHDQRPEKSRMICASCMASNCAECIDTIRIAYADEPLCQCGRKDHPAWR